MKTFLKTQAFCREHPTDSQDWGHSKQYTNVDMKRGMNSKLVTWYSSHICH